MTPFMHKSLVLVYVYILGMYVHMCIWMHVKYIVSTEARKIFMYTLQILFVMMIKAIQTENGYLSTCRSILLWIVLIHINLQVLFKKNNCHHYCHILWFYKGIVSCSNVPTLTTTIITVIIMIIIKSYFTTKYLCVVCTDKNNNRLPSLQGGKKYA